MFDRELEQFPRVRALVWFDVDKEQRWSLRSSQPAYEAWLAGSAQLQAALPEDRLF
jgi:hypothetical protein